VNHNPAAYFCAEGFRPSSKDRQAFTRQRRLPACPHCGAHAGQPCRNRLGEVLSGPHFQRTTAQRAAIQAAMYLYAPLKTANSSQLSANRQPGRTPQMRNHNGTD